MGFINSHYKFIICISQPSQAKPKTFFYEILQEYRDMRSEILDIKQARLEDLALLWSYVVISDL